MMPGDSACKCALARWAVHPGFSRPIIESHQAWWTGMRPFLSSAIRRSAQSGIATSYRLPTSTPKKEGGVTPMTGNVWPSSVTVRFSTPGSPPISRCQNA